ncbi:dihydrodipicolinate synthase family protein [Flavitalea flava]
MNNKKSSRRIFIERIAAASLSLPFFLQATARKNSNGISPAYSRSPEKKFVPVMITPFGTDGKIDFDGLSRLIDFYLAAGVKGFFANCLSSEMYSLSEEERLALTRHVVKKVNGRVPVVATGSFGKTMEEKAEFSKRIYMTGISGVILITSHFAEKDESDEVLFRRFEQFCNLTDNIPLGLYECPSPYKRIIGPGLFRSLLDTNRLVYFKDTTIDIEKVKAKLALIGDNRLEFYDAHTPNAMDSLRSGAKGMSSIAGNFYPEILVWICNNATNPDRQEEVKWMQSELTKADIIVSRGYPMSAKYFLQKRGLPLQTISRSSPAELTPEHKKDLDNLHSVFLGWCTRLKIPV